MTALSNMAAANRSPGLGDARVPCPLCGGLIHPVAGRCKHCKEDLSSFRAGRPQAATPLPSLQAQPGAYAQTPAVAAAPPNGQATAIPVTVPVGREDSQPILPPRPTSQWRMKAQGSRAGWLRNWPMIVIVVAVVAIVAAVVIMVLPEDEAKRGGKKQLMAPPAPDRMETSPMPPQSGQIDPWGSPDDQPDPGAQPPMPATPDPDPDPPDPDDLFGGLGGSNPNPMMGGLSGTFMLTMFHQACRKLQSCPGTDMQTLSAVCSQFNSLPRPAVPSGCPSAQKCLDAIDALDCSANLDNPLSAIALIQDCSKAMTEC